MDKPHVLLCVMGRTACGKDSLVNKLCNDNGLTQLISYTTRSRRKNEGDTHIFSDENTYWEMKNNGLIAAETKIGEYYYWSTIDQIYESDIYIIDFEGLKRIRDLNLPDLRIVSVFINVPDDIRKDRALNKRKDDRTKFIIRNQAEKRQFDEMLKKGDFDYAVQNIRFPEAYSVLKWISTAEGIWKNKENE